MLSSKEKPVDFDLNTDQFKGVSNRSSSSTTPDSDRSSTETVLHHPVGILKENSSVNPHSRFLSTHNTHHPPVFQATSNQPNLPRSVLAVTTGISQVLGFPPIDAPCSYFDASITQRANWQLPEDISNALKYQAKHHRPTQSRERSFERQLSTPNRVFDPEDGTIWPSCTECEPSGGPTDCQHPNDPKKYSTELNPIPKDDPAFQRCESGQLLRFGPKKSHPGSKYISQPSPSTAAVTPENKISEGCSPPSGIEVAFQGLSSFAQRLRAKGQAIQHLDEMLAARHLSNFLTQNVEAGVASNYIIFTTHGTLLGYSSTINVTTARSIAAITGLTWRANDSALLRGADIGPIPGGASLLKTLEITQAEKGPGLFNMICEYKKYLMAVQWVTKGILVAAMIELDEPAAVKGKGLFAVGAGSQQESDEAWDDERAVESTSEDGEDQAKSPSMPSKLFQKSQGLASALREQWKVDGF
ncbi:MAG: hypothetical protein Q9200_006495, partial [Gallowayella weberi]